MMPTPVSITEITYAGLGLTLGNTILINYSLAFDIPDFSTLTVTEAADSATPLSYVVESVGTIRITQNGTTPAAGTFTLTLDVPTDSFVRSIANGNIFKEQTLKDLFTQMMIVAGTVSEGRLSAFKQNLDMGGNKIVNLADGTDPQDAVTRSYGDLNYGAAAAASANASAIAAALSETNSDASALASSISEANSEASAVSSAVSAAEAVVSASSAATSAAEATLKVPAVTTDNAFYRFDGTDGTGQDSQTLEDDSGNLTVAGTVDGRDIATDGTKLDGIELLADVTDEANVTSALDGATFTAVTVAGTDKVVVQDASDSDNIKTVTAQSIADLGGGATAPNCKFATSNTAATQSSTSTTYTNITGMAVTITPTATNSRIQISVGCAIAVNLGNTKLGMRLTRNGTAIADTDQGLRASNTSGQFEASRFNQIFVDEPNTTSPVTYRLQFARYAGGGTCYVNPAGNDGGERTIIVEEKTV